MKEYDANAVAEKVPIASKSGAPKWKSAVDKRYNRVYYVNSLTGESTWTRPKDFDGVEAKVEPGPSEKKRKSQTREEETPNALESDKKELPRVSTEPALRRSQIQRENASLFHTKSMDNVNKSNALMPPSGL